MTQTVALLEEALSAARALGYQVRWEWLDGQGGGACQYGGRRWLFVDLALSAGEQLEMAVEALARDPRCGDDLSRELSLLLQRRRASRVDREQRRAA